MAYSGHQHCYNTIQPNQKVQIAPQHQNLSEKKINAKAANKHEYACADILARDF